MRRALTPREKADLIAIQRGLCVFCWNELEGFAVEFDHSTPVALGNGAKPDQAIHRACHALKTKRDVKAIAKAKRLHRTFVLGERKVKRKMQSRPFDKRWSRRMNGQTVPRQEER